ncbi:glycosyltransferase [Aurantimonas aggregata]|uniref:Glycosyltransferase n=1 Tax=Aurantimonas aggregata TaxID=2047720 RepID=A0A6L9MNI9_9HYPH|nr:glycosyltransferase family 39 protein [Aurantimonas aggregata]NDV89383.1 glycosyltransferase [Aurantimonas aggregata]
MYSYPRPSPDAYTRQSSVSIIVPTLNEAENVDRTLRAIIENIDGRFGFEIIVTDGGSTDGTRERVACWEKDRPVRLLENVGGGGLAKDVRAAALSARFPIVVVLDADGSHPASAIPSLVDPVASGEYDIAIGSRYVAGGATVAWPFPRQALSRLGAALAAPFTDIQDPLSGFFAIRRTSLLAAGENAEGFKIGLEAIVAGGDGVRVYEVPISFSDRVHGTSKIGTGQAIAYLNQLLRYARGTTSAVAMHRFALVGLVGFLLDFLVVTVLQSFGTSIAIAHVSGFCLSAAFNYLGHMKWSFHDRPPVKSQFARFILVSAMAIALRGGFIAAATDLGLPFFTVVFAGIAGGGVVSYIGNEFYVFRNDRFLSSAAQWRLAALAIAVYAVALRIVYQGSIDLIPQEAYYWNYAQHPALGYLDHPPMVAWLIWLGTSVFGDNEFGVRIVATLAWMTTAFFIFRLTKNLFGQTAAFLALMLLSVLPFYFLIGILTTPDAPLTAAWAGALYFLERALRAKDARAWLGAGLCVGLGMLSKYTIALLGPATLVYLLVDPQSRQWLLTRWPYLCAGVVAVVFTPVIAWNANHDWASFHFQGSRRWLQGDLEFSTPTLVLCIAALLGPIGISLAGHAASRMVRFPARTFLREAGMFVIVFTLAPLSVFVFYSLFHSVKLNWTGPVWLALVPAMANVVVKVIKQGDKHLFMDSLKITMAVSVVSFALLFHYVALGLPLIGHTGDLRGLPVAWEEFGAEAERIRASVESGTGQPPLLVGMDPYNIASELGFYSTGPAVLEHVTSQNLFGSNGLMFDTWFSNRSSDGRDVIMVGVKEAHVSDDGLEAWFETIGPIKRQAVRKNGTVVGRFFYRIGYGFRHPD